MGHRDLDPGWYSYSRPSGEQVLVCWSLYGSLHKQHRVSVAIDGDEVSASPWLTKDDPYEWALQYEREDRRLYAELLAANTPAA